MITNFIPLDFNKEADLNIPSVQYDSGSRFVKIRLQQNKVPLEINGYRVTVVANKVDGTEIMNDCTILDGVNGLVQFEITEQFNAVEGVVDCQLKLFKDEILLTSMPFNISVVKSVSTKEIVSSNELKTLVNALGEVQNIDNRFAQTNAQLSKKANKSEIGSPLIANSVSEMTDTSKVYVNVSDGGWYSHNGNSWVRGGLYNSQGIGDNEITPVKTTFFLVNSIFNDNDFINGGVWFESGLQAYENWSYIDKSIPVEPNTTYYINGVTDYHINLLQDNNIITRHLAKPNGFIIKTSTNEVKVQISFLTAELKTAYITKFNADKYQLNNNHLTNYDNHVLDLSSQFLAQQFTFNKSGGISVEDRTITISGLRVGRMNGTFIDCENTSFEITSSFDYIIADISSQNDAYTSGKIALRKGSQPYFWKEILSLSKNEVILCYSNDGQWFSSYPVIQQELSKNNSNYDVITVNEITVGNNCEFTDIKEALNSINDNSSTNQYILRVKSGTYDYSNDGDIIGLKLKNFVTIDGGDKSKVTIIKNDNSFSWSKATVDIDTTQIIEYTSIKNCTIVSNNCKCPLHIDNTALIGKFEGINLDLINLQTKGTGDYPSNGSPNCGAFGWKNNSHIKLSNVRANGKLWGHNYTDTKSNGVIEFVNCNCKKLQFGDLTSQGKDKIIVKGCKADMFEHLWFSEYESSKDRKPSFEFELYGNNITKSSVKDHAEKHDALNDYFGGKYPFNLNEIHAYVYCTEDLKLGDVVYKKNFDNLYEVTKNINDEAVGRVIENKSYNMVLVEKI